MSPASLLPYALLLGAIGLLYHQGQSTRNELTALQLNLHEQYAKVMATTRATEERLYAANLRAADHISEQTQAISRQFAAATKTLTANPPHFAVGGDAAALTDAGLQCTASTNAISSTSLPPDTCSAPSLAAAAQNRPPATGASLCQNALNRCKARVLYEAKEYDILAVHYNALLKLYTTAQESVNDKHKQDRQSQRQDQSSKG